MTQESEREFSSIFVFKIKNRSSNTLTAQPGLEELSDSLMNKAFKFEPDDYRSDFAKPIVFDRKRTLLIPYYEITEERVTEDVTDKEKIGEVIPQTKTVQIQNLKYIVDANIYANDGLILVCRVDTIDRAEQILAEYLQTIGLDESYVHNFLYGQSSVIMQQLLLTLYDYWPTGQSQITSLYSGLIVRGLTLFQSNKSSGEKILSILIILGQVISYSFLEGQGSIQVIGFGGGGTVLESPSAGKNVNGMPKILTYSASNKPLCGLT